MLTTEHMGTAYRKQKNAQLAFLMGAGLFALFLVSVAIYRSVSRHSVIGSGSSPTDSGALASSGRLASGTSSEFHLQDFHRLGVKDGNTTWEVAAKDAKYFPQGGLTQVSDVNLIIYRENDSKVLISADAAKLYLEAGGLSKAELEGNVVVNMDATTVVQTSFAIYDVTKREIRAPGEARINGAGFDIYGEGLNVEVSGQNFEIERRVFSQFENWAAVPKSVTAIGR